MGSAALDPASLGVVSVFRVARDEAGVGPLTHDPNGLSGLPHSFSGAAESRPHRLAELTPLLEMADEARNVAQPPPDVSHARRLVDAEVVGDGVHVQDPKDEPRDGDRDDECARNQDQARDSAGREVSRATWQPPGVAYAGSDFVAIRLDTTPRAVGERRPSRQSGVWRTEPAKRDDGSMEERKNEGEVYRQILRRAKRVREAAAESLRRSRASRKQLGDEAQRRRRFRQG